MSKRAKDPAAVALGRKARGVPKTMTRAGKAACRANLAKARARRWLRDNAGALLKRGLEAP